MSRRVVVSVVLAGAVLAQLVGPKPAYAFVPPSAGTLAAIGESLMGAAPGASAAIAAAGTDPTAAAGGALVAVPTDTGFATFAVPAITASAPWAAAALGGAVLGGLVGAVAATLFYDPDPSKHPTDVPFRFVPTGTAGSIEVELGTQKTAEDVWGIISTDGDPRGDSAYNWGCGTGHSGFIALSNGTCGGTATIFYQAAGVIAGAKSSLTFYVAGNEASGIATGPGAVGARMTTAAPYFFANQVALTAGQATCLVTGGIGTHLFANTVNWNNYYGGSISEITPKRLDGTDGLTNTADPAVAARIRQLSNPEPTRFGGPAYQVTPPTGNTASDPPVIYQDPATGQYKISPHGLPAGDDGKPTAARAAYDPASGQMVAEMPTPAPTATPAPTPTPMPTPTPKPTPVPVSATTVGTAPGESFVKHFFDVVATKFPFDWFSDVAAVGGSEPTWEYVSFQGKDYEGLPIENRFSLEFAKPYVKALVVIATIGLGVAALLWI